MDRPPFKFLSWYHTWHKHPRHQHAHWLFFFATLILASSFLSIEIGGFYLENNYQTKAQLTSALGSPPYGGQGICPPGYIELAGADASSVDAANNGFYCDNDPPYATQVTYPVQGLLVCDSPDSDNTAFIVPAYVRCQTWDFSSGTANYPTGLIAEMNCSSNPISVTIPDGNISAGDFTTSPSDRAAVCIIGTDTSNTPPPTPSGPPPRYIYYIAPSTTQAGDTIIISGQNLTPTVTFLDPSGSPTQIQGILNSSSTQVTVVIPLTLGPNTYNVSVGPNPNSNKVTFQVIISSPPPPGPSATSPATPCDPATIQIATQNNVSILCDFGPSTVYPGDTVTMTGVFLVGTVYMTPTGGSSAVTINGSVNSTGDLVTFLVPANTAPGDYVLSNAGANGNASISKLLNVQIPTANQSPNPPFPPPPGPQSTPPATQFQDLISNAFNYSLIVVGIAVFIMILWGGFLWLTSAANPGNIATAKRYIFNAILGAILLISAYVILYTINPELVGGSLNLSGIQAPPTQATTTSKLIATTEIEASSAITAGCIIGLDARDFTSLECDQSVSGGLNLLINPVISTTDSNVNSQIGATAIQNNGNLGAGRKIVILDTGYDYNNPDLRSSYLPVGRDFINNDNDPMDDNTIGGSAPGHGSHIAGIITGDGINSQTRGVAPQAGIIAGKILDARGGGNWDKMIEAIKWAVDGPDGIHGTGDDFNADVINISLGSTDANGNPFTYSGICDNSDELTKRTVKTLQYARDNGVLPIIAAGNGPNGVTFPGCIDAAFTVGAVDNSDRIANFSGRGSPVDIVAPGVNVYSSLLGNNYGLKSGTSMATPAVSGAAALLKSANPNYTPDELEKLMTSTACDLGQTGKDTTFGWGRVSLNPGSCTPPPPPSPSGPTGIVTTSPTSCTKGVIPSNPNCDTNISYRITGITSATQLTVGKDNNFFQNIQCSSSPCSGQLTDSSPTAGLHQYDFRIGNNVIARGNAYVFTRGTITANFSSCSKFSNLNNQNCDVTLNINAPGVNPNSLIVTKDGFNWRLVPCSNSQCTASLVDSDPALGTHTYSISDASDNTSGRLGRTTVTITTSTQIPPPIIGSVTLCTDINFGGVCETFVTNDPDLSDNLIGNDTVSSIRLNNTSDVRLCTNINYSVCEDFTASDADLRGNLVGNDTASSIGSI